MNHRRISQVYAVGSPPAFIEMNPEDARTMEVVAGDAVDVCIDFGSTCATTYRQKAVKAGQTYMLFGSIRGVAGAVTSPLVDRNVVPYYKGT